MCESLKPLLEKLKRAKFTGRLQLIFEGGEITSGKLRHYLPLAELGRELPTVEPEKEFSLKP